MGRVSSKRKIKQCDPFFKGKRENGKKAKAYDLPPVESKRSKKRRRKALNEDAVERFVMQSSEVGHGASKGGSMQHKLDIDSIREGETMKDFQKRISTEVKRVIYEESKKSRKSSEKKKEYLMKKKQKLKEKKMTDQERYEHEYQATGNTKKDYFEGAERVRFGERVDAPPILPKLTGLFKKRAEAAAANGKNKKK